jgi:hypothetical protein
MLRCKGNCMSLKETFTEGVGCVFGGIIGLTMLGAWITHVYFCLSDGRWGFLIAGAIFFPIAIVHGIGIWLGFFTT